MQQPQPSKVEVIKQAIKQAMEEEKENVEDDSHHRILSTLMSQLERLEAEANTDGFVDPAISKSSGDENEEERIVEELKKVKRQNFITHCLLSAMIVLTVAWQISEVSIILKLRDGVTHPFRSIGSIFKWILKAPKRHGNAEETEKPSLIESSPMDDVNIPHIELPKIGLSLID